MALALADVLRGLGHEPRLARTAELALRVLQHDAPDAILLDVSLPRMSGLDFLRRPEVRAARVPIVALSGSATDEDILEFLRVGALDFLGKPVGLELLQNVLRYALQRGCEARWPQSERRRSRRPRMVRPAAVLEYDGPAWQGMSVDLSTFGVRIRSEQVDRGQPPSWAAKVHLRLPHGEPMFGQLSVLVRSDVGERTFRFVNLEEREFDRLRTWSIGWRRERPVADRRAGPFRQSSPVTMTCDGSGSATGGSGSSTPRCARCRRAAPRRS
jgi:CheY-like chemotaxis protein